jgi:hypothetical protein
MRELSANLSRVKKPSGLVRTPTWTIIVTEATLGLVLVIFAILNAVDIAGTTEGLLAVGLGTVGGMTLGMALGMTRHRLAAHNALDGTLDGTL